MLPAWPFGFLPGSPGVLYPLFLGLTLTFGDDHKSIFFSSGGVLYVLVGLLLLVCSEHFSSRVLFRLIGFLSQGAIVDFGLLTRGCGTPSSRHRRQHGWTCPQPAYALMSSPFSRPASGNAYVFLSLMLSTVSRLSYALVTWLS